MNGVTRRRSIIDRIVARRTMTAPTTTPTTARMRRTSSLEDVRAFVSHFPTHLSWRAARESFAHEATQYALWVPCAWLARACGCRTMSYLFMTWFVLGELMLVYTHEAHRRVVRAVRWWHVSAAIACAAAARGGPPTRETFGRFFVDYVFWGVLAMACVFPLVPKSFRRDVPDMIYSLGFLPTRGDAKREDET